MLKAKSFKKETCRVLRHIEGGMLDIHIVHVAKKLAASFGIEIEYM